MLQVGFDAGSNLFGLCAITEGDSPGQGRVYLTAIPRPYPKAMRFLKEAHAAPVAMEIVDRVRAWMNEAGETRVTLNVEEYFPGRGSAQWVVPWLQGYVVGYFIREMKTTSSIVQLNYVMPITWKKNLIGKKTNGKEMVEDRVRTVCHQKQWKISSDSKEQDQYDAFGIAYYGLLLSKGTELERNAVKHESVKDGALF